MFNDLPIVLRTRIVGMRAIGDGGIGKQWRAIGVFRVRGEKQRVSGILRKDVVGEFGQIDLLAFFC